MYLLKTKQAQKLSSQLKQSQTLKQSALLIQFILISLYLQMCKSHLLKQVLVLQVIIQPKKVLIG